MSPKCLRASSFVRTEVAGDLADGPSGDIVPGLLEGGFRLEDLRLPFRLSDGRALGRSRLMKTFLASISSRLRLRALPVPWLGDDHAAPPAGMVAVVAFAATAASTSHAPVHPLHSPRLPTLPTRRSTAPPTRTGSGRRRIANGRTVALISAQGRRHERRPDGRHRRLSRRRGSCPSERRRPGLRPRSCALEARRRYPCR